MMAKGSYARIILATADLDGACGVRDLAVRDPAGNLIRVNEVR